MNKNAMFIVWKFNASYNACTLHPELLRLQLINSNIGCYSIFLYKPFIFFGFCAHSSIVKLKPWA